jgi:nucleoside-diphosphate-sugar epimerase
MGRGGSPFHGGVGNFQRNAVVQLFGKGNNKLPTVLVEDVAAGIIAAAVAPGIDGESFNLVGDPMLSANESLDELERQARIRLRRGPTPIYQFYATEMFKWVIKLMVRHHNRTMPSYADWDSRTQNAYFDCSKAKQRLNWRPVHEREVLIDRGIRVPVEEFHA